MTQISCVYSRTATGRLALVFAADLWSKLHGVSSATASSKDQPLHVYLRSDPDGAAAIEASMTKAIGNLMAVEANLVRSDVLAKTNLAPDSIVLDSNHAANGVIVDHNLAFERADLSVLFPCRESTLLGRGNGPILIPFGDGQSVMPAAQVGFAMAKKLDLPVVLYHTTWTVPGLTAADPQAHMCASAQALLKTLQSMAEKSGVECSVVVETADDVVEGLLHCALRQSARLIVMSRSAKTTIGCYVSQTLRKTPIPLLAIASPRTKVATVKNGGAA
jgi:nucleotide-binding universal stress UspA family protein